MEKSKLLFFIVLSVIAGVHSYAQSRVRGLTSAEMEEAKKRNRSVAPSGPQRIRLLLY